MKEIRGYCILIVDKKHFIPKADDDLGYSKAIGIAQGDLFFMYNIGLAYRFS